MADTAQEAKMKNKKYVISIISLGITFILLIIALFYISGINISIKKVTNTTENKQYNQTQDMIYQNTYNNLYGNLSNIAQKNNATLINLTEQDYFSGVMTSYMLLPIEGNPINQISEIYNSTVNYLASQGISNESIIYYDNNKNSLFAVSFQGDIITKNHVFNVNNISMDNISINAYDMRSPKEVLSEDMPLIGCNNAKFNKTKRTITFNCTSYPYKMSKEMLNSTTKKLKTIGYITTGLKNFTMDLYYTSSKITHQTSRNYPDNISFMVSPNFYYDLFNNFKNIAYSKNTFN